MKKTLLGLGLFLAMMASCSAPAEKSASVIEKKDLKIENGHMTPEIMLTLGAVSDPQVSPDGSKILYGVTYTSIEENRRVRQLYVMDIDGSNRKQLTHFSSSASNARWYDGGKSILFLQGGQIHIMNADGKNIRKVSDVQGGISEFKLSPAQDRLMYISEIQSAIKPTDLYPDLPQSSGRTITDLMYRHWDHFVETIPHTFVADFAPHSGTMLTEGTDIIEGTKYELPTLPFGGLEQLSWSPDGKYIAYSCRKLTGKDYAFSTNTDIYLYNVADRTCENLTEGMMGYDTEPLFSPDGKTLAWISMERGGFEADKQRLFIIDLESRVKKELSANFKYNVSNISWSADGQRIYFASLCNAIQALFYTDMNANITRITKEDAWYDFRSPVEINSNELIAMNTSMYQPAEIISVNIADGSFKNLSNENTEFLSKLDMGKCELRLVKTTDNKDMYTWVLFPPKFDPDKKYPAMLFCNGGPQGTLSQSFSTRWNFALMASQGYVVVLPNRRGTTAFGQEWTDQISGDYMGQNMQDYLSAARMIKSEPYITKLGASGASYGGFSIYYLAGIHKNTFDAFLAHAGIFNQEHMYMMTEELWFPQWDNGGAPWDNNPVAKRHYANSAHKLVKNWNTPIMITHGEMDYRVPVDQGMAAFNCAQMMGVPSRMLLFPEENHWILRPQNAVHWQREFFAWFDKWLKN